MSTRSSPAANSGSTSRSTSRAHSAFSSSGLARSVEPWMRARLPISASRFSSPVAPAETPIVAMRPPIASASRLPARFGAPPSSRITSKGPRSAKPSRAIAGAEAPRARSHGGDLAGELEAGDVRGRAGGRGVEAAPLQHVGAVQAGGANAHQDLARARDGVRMLLHHNLLVANRRGQNG